MLDTQFVVSIKYVYVYIHFIKNNKIIFFLLYFQEFQDEKYKINVSILLCTIVK